MGVIVCGLVAFEAYNYYKEFGGDEEEDEEKELDEGAA